MPRETDYRFDNFVVGTGNRLAVAAAKAVAESPGAVYNPLFVYGAAGLGKTHLLVALGALATQLDSSVTPVYVTLDELVEQRDAARAAGTGDEFKHRYESADVLLLDDMQRLTGRPELQSEMLRLFTVLQGRSCQIVMASDRPPSDIADVDERVRSRLGGGLIVDIGAPDYETRIAILRHKCEERGLQFRTGVIEELASIEFASVRELQSALERLAAHQAHGEGPLGAPQVRALVGAPPAREPRRTSATPSEFQSFLADVTSVVAQSVESWKTRIGEGVAHWHAEGYRTGVLERALELPAAPDVDGLLSTFAAAVEHLHALEQRVSAVDAAAAASDVFRDPERIADAERLAERVMARYTPLAGPAAAFAREAFEVGSSNENAVRAADVVIADPGRRYNPLFLHGPSGVGKTHLANAIGNELIDQSGSAMRVSCVNAQTFIDELVTAIQEGAGERWRGRYRAADALIIDDVQFVAGKERTQEELFHLFNAFHDAGKQIVLTSDRPPEALGDLEDRLRSRFTGGLAIAMGQPDRALRAKLYARYLSLRGVAADAALLEYLAGRPASSVREIIGAVNRLTAAAEFAHAPVSLDLARRELEGTTAPAPVVTAALDPAADAFFLDEEKVIWEWPDVVARMTEEPR